MFKQGLQFGPFDIGSDWLRAQLIKDFVMLGHVYLPGKNTTVTEKWLHRNSIVLFGLGLALGLTSRNLPQSQSLRSGSFAAILRA